MTYSETDHVAIVDTARTIQSRLDGTSLYISGSRSRFDTKISSEDVNLNLPISMAEKSSLVDPASVTADVSAQLASIIYVPLELVGFDVYPQAFFRKLKFQYLEQKAKDQYIKTIVSDDAPNITAADNEDLRKINDQKKQGLKVEKQALSEAYNNIQTLSPLVEQG